MSNKKSEGDLNNSNLRQSWQSALEGTLGGEIVNRDSHLFLHQALSTPCLDAIKSASGIYITDANGKSYMDFHGNNVHQLGYGHPRLLDALNRQLHSLPFCPRRYTNLAAVDYAQKLVSLLPSSLCRVLLAPGGTSAVSMAIKLSRLITGRFKTIAYWDSFHGASLDAISVGGQVHFQQSMGPMLPGCIHIPAPSHYRNIWKTGKDDTPYADYLDYVIEKEGDVSALIVEPIRNTEVEIPSKAYWKRVREICDRHQVLLIFDEIPLAFGRTGKMFALEHFDIVPDILCLGKGMGGALIPMAGIVTRDCYNEKCKDLSIGHFTFEKNPLGCAVGLELLRIIEEEEILAKVRSDGDYMEMRLRKMQSIYPFLGDVRGVGLLWGIELVKNEDLSRDVDRTEQILYECLREGLSFKVSQGNILQLSPPLVISREELEKALNILEKAIDKYANPVK